jgi:hypothetical protein
MELHHEISGELVMVIFILCLLAFFLAVITFTHYIIEKPQKRKMLKALRDFLIKKSGSSETGIKSIFSSPSFLGSKRRESNPTDSSISSNKLKKHVEQGNGSESEKLLSIQNSTMGKSEYIPLSSIKSSFVPGTDKILDQKEKMHKVTFNICETIIEESPSQSVAKLDHIYDDTPYQESIRSISHLLDDKPWLYPRPSPQTNFNFKSFKSNKPKPRSNSVI